MTEEEYSEQAFRDLAEWEKEVLDYNNSILSGISKTAIKHFGRMLEDCSIPDKIEIVSQPKGKPQGEKYGPFKNVHVDQWSVGMEGDSFAGFLYANYQPDKWLKIYYEC